MSYQTETIKNIVQDISKNKYLLPAIQRELVWDYSQIEKLFDSILSGYPFGSLLFWKYKKDESNAEYKFYEFIKNYDEYNKQNNHNQEHVIKGKDEINAVLDGQQRITALVLGLKGSLNLHRPRTKWDNASNFDKKYLYINLFYNKQELEDDDIKPEYEVKFKTEYQVNNENETQEKLWFKIGDLLEWKEKKEWKEIIKNKNLSEEQKDNIENIFSALYDNFIVYKRVSYYEEETNSLDKILKIFVRINSGGTPLDYTDFLMSMIINQWGDGREEINRVIDNISKDHNLDIPKHIFLRGCLFLTDSNLNFNIDNFKQDTVQKIKSNFDNISKYIKASCSIFNDLGYTKDNLRSNLILLPLAYFLMKNNNTKLDDTNLKNVNRWIQLSILNRVFGGQTTSYLKKLREDIIWNEKFPLEQIIKISNTYNKNMDINEDSLDDIIEKAKKGSQDSWALLTLLYPSNNYKNIIFHEDHIYPYSKLSDKQKSYGGNFIANLQLLDSYANQSKNDTAPNEWIVKYCKSKNLDLFDYKKNNFIPTIDLTFENFDEFIRLRKELIKQQILKLNTIF